MAPDRHALGLRRDQRSDRPPQPLVPGRVAAADGPALARFRPGRWPYVPARAARRRLGARAVPRGVDFPSLWPTITITTSTTTTTAITTMSTGTGTRSR